MKLFKTIALLIALWGYSISFAQTSAEIDKGLNEKYWMYRDRFKKRFVFIGKNDGQSLPFLTLFEGYNAPIIPQSTLSDNTKIDADKQTMISGRMSKGEMGIELGN